jgi:DNA-binding HxlR family transcriptional regulator
VRTGGHTLTLLGVSRTFLILRSLEDGAKSRQKLRRHCGFPAQSTLRGHLAALEAEGLVEHHRRNSSAGALEYELTASGRELLAVAAGIERWLEDAPGGPLELGHDAAKAAIQGLVAGWTTTVLTELAVESLSLTELDKRISTVSYPTIERCLEAMRLAQQLEVGSRTATGRPHTLSDWLRRGIAPLVLAARWEHRHRPAEAASICLPDVAGAFLLLSPMVDLPARPSGICQMALRPPDGDRRKRVLNSVELRDGRIAFGPVYPHRRPDAWMSATADGWFSTVVDGDPQGLRISGDRQLAADIWKGLHRALASSPAVPVESFPK